MTTSSPKRSSRTVAHTDPLHENTPPGRHALRLLETQHPELLKVLRAHATDAECTLNVSALPRHSRQLLWKLYQANDPVLAEWMRSVAEARELLDATLCLKAQDILRFLAIEVSDITIEIEPATAPA